MRVCVPRESGPGEHRVALAPDSVSKLTASGFELAVERGAGVLAGFPDELYTEAGATLADVPAVTPESTALARELKRRGLVFVGPTTAYAAMQACGLVDDHLDGCVIGR